VDRVDAINYGNAETRLLSGGLNLRDEVLPLVGGQCLVVTIEYRSYSVLSDRFLQFGRINLNALIVTADDHLQSKLGHLAHLLFNGHLLQQAFDLLRVITLRPTRTNRVLKELIAVVDLRVIYSVLVEARG
jgi:hypothetical protein